MAEVFIVVHANSSWNELGLWQGHCDTELSETGLMMANSLAECRDLNNVKQIHSSDLKRAWQTAVPLASKLKLDIIKDPFLREGRWADHDIQDNVSILPAPYDYEDRAALGQRAISTLNRIVHTSPQFPILIVTHGTFLECFIETISSEAKPAYKGVRTAINSFECVDGIWKINQLNDVLHLPEVTANMICVTDKIS
jgi:broad specificity phosphatase PhoE